MKNAITYTSELIGVTKTYLQGGMGTSALKEASLAVEPGKVILLLGPSGSGKTTLLTIMGGLQAPTSGKVFLFGNELKEYTQKQLQFIRATSVGFIFQTFKLIDSLTVMQNVLMVSFFGGKEKSEAIDLAMKYLNMLGVGHLAGSRPATLSQGEKQRVAASRALVNGARLIIADEPTGSLSTDQGMVIIEHLREISTREGRSIVIASHDERISRYADRVYDLSDGALSERI